MWYDLEYYLPHINTSPCEHIVCNWSVLSWERGFEEWCGFKMSQNSWMGDIGWVVLIRIKLGSFWRGFWDQEMNYIGRKKGGVRGGRLSRYSSCLFFYNFDVTGVCMGQWNALVAIGMVVFIRKFSWVDEYLACSMKIRLYPPF